MFSKQTAAHASAKLHRLNIVQIESQRAQRPYYYEILCFAPEYSQLFLNFQKNVVWLQCERLKFLLFKICGAACEQVGISQCRNEHKICARWITDVKLKERFNFLQPMYQSLCLGCSHSRSYSLHRCAGRLKSYLRHSFVRAITTTVGLLGFSNPVETCSLLTAACLRSEG